MCDNIIKYCLMNFLKNPHLEDMSLILGREEGRERERKRHQLVASHTCSNWGWNPQTRKVPWPGIKPAAFRCTGWCSNQPCHLARVLMNFYIVVCVCTGHDITSNQKGFTDTDNNAIFFKQHIHRVLTSELFSLKMKSDRITNIIKNLCTNM